MVASGAEGGGFTIAVFPASSACGNEAPRIAIGQLNGTITVTTPSGWYDTSVDTGMAPGTGGSVLEASTSSASMRARFQRISNTSPSIHASIRTLPFSCDRIAASSSRSSAIPAMASAIFAARSCGVSAAHAGKACFAAATASFTSETDAAAASPTTTPGRPGSGMVSTSSVKRSSPPMYSPVRTDVPIAVSPMERHLSVLSGSGSRRG